MKRIEEMEAQREALIPKDDRLTLLWDIAKTAAGLVYDQQGNEVLMNPAASVAAIRTITDIEGDWAPKQSEVNVNVNDTRSVKEIQSSVHDLMLEYKRLNGETIQGELDSDVVTVPALTSD